MFITKTVPINRVLIHLKELEMNFLRTEGNEGIYTGGTMVTLRVRVYL